MEKRCGITTVGALPALVISSLLMAPAARAADQVMGFKGTLTSYLTSFGYVEIPDVPVGSVVRGQVLYDDSETDLDGSSTSGSYPYTTLALGLEGTTELHIGINAVGSIRIKNDDPVGGGDFRDEVRLTLDDFLLIPSLSLTAIDLQFRLNVDDNPAPTVLSSDALPSPLPDLSSFTGEQLLTMIGYLDFDVTNFDVAITEFGPVGSPDLPLIPDSVTVDGSGATIWTFSTAGISICVSGCWVDPPVAAGFTYTMTNSALFTGIADFPSGFGSAMDVSVGGSSLGTFGPGDSVDFTGYPGGGVAEFVISGITPAADLTSAEGFPLNLSVDANPAEFTMTSIAPATAVPALGWLAGALIIGSMTVAASRWRTA